MHTVTARIRLASAGLHVIDRWVDALADALPDALVGGSLTGGRIEVTLTVAAPDPAAAADTAAARLDEAIAAAQTAGVRVLDVQVSSR